MLKAVTIIWYISIDFINGMGAISFIVYLIYMGEGGGGNIPDSLPYIHGVSEGGGQYP